MAQIFGKSSNSFARALFAAVFLGFFGFWGVVYAIYRSPYTTDVKVPRVQKVPFSHQHHVSGLGIDCRYCHSSVEKSAFAGIPPNLARSKRFPNGIRAKRNKPASLSKRPLQP